MIITVAEFLANVETTEEVSTLEMKIKAVEQAIRNETNNNFQVVSMRERTNVLNGKVEITLPFFNVNDTVQISKSKYNDGVYTVIAKEGHILTLDGELYDEEQILLTRVKYPPDVKMGAINMIKWDLENRKKVGIKSETLSRHSVTYYDMDSSNSTIGYPSSLVGFLKKYIKPRF